jgi:hypothetical protein
LQHAERAVALLPRARDAAEGPLYLYLLARVHARLGQTAPAFAVLDEMFDALLARATLDQVTDEAR